MSPYTGEPFSEEMILGIGGGIGAEYATWAFKGLDPMTPRRARLYLRFHHVKNYVEKNEESAIHKIASRIGAKLTVRETISREKAYRNLVESLSAGNPVITYLSIWESLNLQREVKKRFENL